MSRHTEVVAALEAAILQGPGETPQAQRRAVADGDAAATASIGPAPAALATYLDKVRQHAYKVTDEDVAALRAAGYSDDQLFELTVATAWGAARLRLRAGLAALHGAKP